jgi:serine/threonine protein kinase
MMERYVKRQQLGAGGQGSVWLVEDQNTGSLAAMKLYDIKDEAADREREMLHRFGGKGVPYLVDYLEHEQKIAIIMEYVEGKSLRQMMKEKKLLDEKEGIRIAAEIAKILGMFHKQVPAVIYGDLKPENIMLTKEGQVMLLDFGSVLYEGERERKVFGTSAYLPPNQEGKVTPYRDTYGLGVILYEMLTGCRLSEGLCNGKADISHLSRESREIMQKAVHLHETEGYQDAGRMYEALRACSETIGEVGKMKRKNKRKRKEKNYYIGDVRRMLMHGYIRGLCLVAAGILIGMLWKGDTEKTEVREVYQSTQSTVLRDEYGRKVLVRNLTDGLTDGKEKAYNIP